MTAHGHQRHSTGTGNRIILGSTGEFRQAQGHQLLDTAEEFAHDLVGIGPILMNLHTGMSALQAIHRQLHAGAIDCSTLNGHGNGASGTAGAGNGEHTLLLGVDVNQGTSLKFGQVDAGGTFHAGLLIHGNDHLQRRMGNGLVCQDGQCISQSNAIIAAQGRPLGEHIAAIVRHIQALGLQIDGTVLILFANHVHMALDNHRGMILHAAGAFLEHNHVVQLILHIPDSMLLGKGHQIVADGLGIARSVRDGTDFLKISKYCRRLQTCQFHSLHNGRSFILYRVPILPRRAEKVHQNGNEAEGNPSASQYPVFSYTRCRDRARTIHTRAIHLVQVASFLSQELVLFLPM